MFVKFQGNKPRETLRVTRNKNKTVIFRFPSCDLGMFLSLSEGSKYIPITLKEQIFGLLLHLSKRDCWMTGYFQAVHQLVASSSASEINEKCSLIVK